MQAIAIPYCVDQHEPSRPIKHLIEVDDGPGRDAMLKQLFIETVYDGATLEEITVREGEEWDYGDIVVAAHEDFFLFITFLRCGPTPFNRG